jgi:hypothetical protein
MSIYDSTEEEMERYCSCLKKLGAQDEQINLCWQAWRLTKVYNETVKLPEEYLGITRPLWYCLSDIQQRADKFLEEHLNEAVDMIKSGQMFSKEPLCQNTINSQASA